ncbi:MAG: ketopantoate reductase family protein [Candidatus Limnocylindria bacterium]
MSNSKIVGVVGAGATGAYLAGRLSRAGLSVTLLARGESFDRIREHGIEITDPDGDRWVANPTYVRAADDLDALDEACDFVLFCVKTYDTDSAAALLGPLIGETGHVVCLQNGVKNEQILASAVGPERVLSGVLYIGSQRVAPGVIECSSPPRVIVGPYDGIDHGASRAVRDAFSAAGIECTVEPEVLAAKWQKFLFNCGLNPLTAITRLRMGQLLAVPAVAAVFDTLVEEAIAAATAAGAPLPADAKDRVMATALRMDISSSMADDLEAGRAIELDAFTGYVIELGEANGVPTPATRVAHGMLAALDAARGARRNG